MLRLVLISVAVVIIGCQSKEGKHSLYTQLMPNKTGISFANNIVEYDSLNYFSYSYMYFGGGVGIGDFNNDGLEDVYLVGNQVSNKLYLNQGGFSFKDITNSSGTSGVSKWYTGVTIVDINQDGWDDIYLSVTGKYMPRQNELYINNGDLTFTESASQYGIDDTGYSYNAAFFDYDLDGDLDLYVSNYPSTNFGASTLYYRKKMDESSWEDSDHLYENIGGTFKDVSGTSGILNFGLSLGLCVEDFNQDGYPDLYISNDFSSPDYFYINQGDKTFEEKLASSFQHTAMYGMGVEASDINNDGLLDVLQMDMSIQDNYRNKANMASMDIPSFWNQVGFGMHYQYMHNMLQLNNGLVNGLPVYSDVSQLSGLNATDWSWSVLAFDADNDAQKDIFITNGTRKQINNKDFFNSVKSSLPRMTDREKVELSNKIPSEPVPNHFFKHSDGMVFADRSEFSGLATSGFSYGVAYSDLDNDGDLDLVVNNIDQEAFVYENTVMSLSDTSTHYLRVKLNGSKANLDAIGAVVYLKADGQTQMLTQRVSRGYLSSVSPVLHFGLGTTAHIDSLIVNWPSGKVSIVTSIAANQVVEISQDETERPLGTDKLLSTARLEGVGKTFSTVVSDSIIDYTHQENFLDDFKKQILLPHKMSQFGPAMAVADFNGDGKDDVFLGAGVGYPGGVYLQEGGAFKQKPIPVLQHHSVLEDIDAAAFDADGDGDMDLYVVSGGNLFPPYDQRYMDRLYLNTGDGTLEYAGGHVPNNAESGSVVRPCDYDKDGDMDLFVGGRHTPHRYPQPASSFIYENRNGKFYDVTSSKGKFLRKIGMVTDAVWQDFDGDGTDDLAVVGEWMTPVLAFQKNGKFEVSSEVSAGLSKMAGWWFAIEAEDLDGDGDQDIVLGNLGKNYKYQASDKAPFKVYSADFDHSGSSDIVLSFEQDGTYYPVRGRQCSSEQIPEIKKKFKNYDEYARADIRQVYGDMGLDDANELNAYTFASTVLLNEGAGGFSRVDLPDYAQVSSVNDIVIKDYDGDNILDLILVGNLYVSEIETTRNDASYGAFLSGNGDGTFTAQMPYQSGFFVKGDSKKVSEILIDQRPHIIVGRNRMNVSLHKVKSSQ